MFTSFQDYLAALKPKLDEAFKRQLSILLGSITLRDAASFMGTLEAGKKIRGCLSCMVSEALGGTLESAIPRAIAVELIQAATLIHDDFVDQDTVRGNRPAAWTLEGARRAVLIGDVIFATAIKMMNDLGREDGVAVSRAIAQVSAGALHEPMDPLTLAQEIKSHRWSDQLYEKIIHLKTGILFGTACHLGAIAAGADEKLGEITYRYGLRIGEAYQIADDLKEVKRHLLRKSIHPEQMVALAPTFLHFVREMRPHILIGLQGKGLEFSESIAEFLNRAVKLMEQEIERRLQSAESEIEVDFPKNEYRELARRTPWDLIRMFNES
jgi:geranylgeranyl pyrophosphate synthase